MITIKETIVVEGRYDIHTVKQLVASPVIETRGFGIFKDSEKLTMLRKIANNTGIVILTDSDGAGFVIRNYLKGALPNGTVKHAYIPDIFGKEHRKRSVSKEGKLGVEGMTQETLLDALKHANAIFLDDIQSTMIPKQRITKADLFAWGLVGGEGSAKRRKNFLKTLGLPEYLSANGMLEVLGMISDHIEINKILNQLEQ